MGPGAEPLACGRPKAGVPRGELEGEALDFNRAWPGMVPPPSKGGQNPPSDSVFCAMEACRADLEPIVAAAVFPKTTSKEISQMAEQVKPKNGVSGEEPEGTLRSTGTSSGGQAVAALAAGQRWSAARKREVVIRMLRGEAMSALSRELGVELYRLEDWHRKALTGIDASLRERGGDPVQDDLDAALKRLGELTMENELLRMRTNHVGPFLKRRSRR